MGSDRSDIDVIRQALGWIVNGSKGAHHYEYERARKALARVAASLAEKDAQIERLIAELHDANQRLGAWEVNDGRRTAR